MCLSFGGWPELRRRATVGTGFQSRSVSLSRLRINHYWAKSEEELREKCAAPQVANGIFRPWPDLPTLRTEFCETDRTILKYPPALREGRGLQ